MLTIIIISAMLVGTVMSIDDTCAFVWLECEGCGEHVKNVNLQSVPLIGLILFYYYRYECSRCKSKISSPVIRIELALVMKCSEVPNWNIHVSLEL